MAPDLALSYSSSAPLFGGVATGWSLSLPRIYRERGLVTDTSSSAPSWRSTLVGDSRLVQVTEPGVSGTSFRVRFGAISARNPLKGSTTRIAINVNQRVKVWTRSAAGDVKYETIPWDVIISHELAHAVEAERGVITDSRVENEFRATGLLPPSSPGLNENSYRETQGLPARICYFLCGEHSYSE